jgi:hypothetical protein
MRIPSLAFLLFALPTFGQVELDAPLHFSGAPPERAVDGLAAPEVQDAALTVEASLLGYAHWAEATLNGDTLVLAPRVPMVAPRDGHLLRFLAPVALAGRAHIACTNAPALPMLRPDGLEPVSGQVRPGQICEVIYTTDHWVLLNAPEVGCPPNTVAVHERLCMEVASGPLTFFYPAQDRCAMLGGRLCSWDEFHYACSQLPTQFTGMLSAWEWIDDSSNHAHSAVLVGLNSCTAERWSHPQISMQGRSRCCFQPR